ncbi:MAG TPA: hypothetical protein VNU01_00905 [Egibacteraceae bacterium]|nr:hypothetical protein [Egibacteraceae bacterium]
MAVLTLLAGCEAPTRTVRVPVGPAPAELTALDRAVADVDAARTALLAAPAAVVSGATAFDAGDEACATGDRARAAEAREAARAAGRQVEAALATYADQLAAYRSTLRTLVDAAAPLDPAQREALAALAQAGERDAAALAAFGDAARAAWPAYTALGQVQSTWLDRASAGWYRSPVEAADAYVVLRRPAVPGLEAARTTLARADSARRPATERVRAALAAANRALDALRAPPSR